MENSKGLIVGGNFSDGFGEQKSSSVISQLSNHLKLDEFNSGLISDIEKYANNLQGYDLVIWAPNVNNEVEKIYPKKAPGSVLICSKVLRENRDFGDAIARIFKMNGNAVITIESAEKPFVFNLIDALGNVWCRTTDLKELALKIEGLYNWTKASIRTGSKEVEFISEELFPMELKELCQVVKDVADKVENERGGRYFGNVSTRCGKMFPSFRSEYDIVLMSGRNVSKSRISPEDFVYTKLVDGKVLYHGEKKPSVDTPIQLSLYKQCKNINFLIHGHAYIDNADYTDHYFPCGDLRELTAVIDKVNPDAKSIVLNLKNHGFIIGADSMDQLKKIVAESVFKHRQVGIEKCEMIPIFNVAV